MNSKEQLLTIKNNVSTLLKLMREQEKTRQKIRATKDKLMELVPAGNTVKIGRYSVYWNFSDKTKISLTKARLVLPPALFNKITYIGQDQSWNIEPKLAKKKVAK